jgi:hypothetical protein
MVGGVEWSDRYIRLRERAPNIDTKIKPSAENEFTEFQDESTYRYRTDQNSYIEPSKIYDDPDEAIVFLGGSSTECRYVEEKERFPYKAGRLIEDETGQKINSYNAGVGGSNSLHSINSLLNKILTLEPDYIVFCHNWNDLNILLFENDYRNDNPSRRPVQPGSLRFDLSEARNQLKRGNILEAIDIASDIYKKVSGSGESEDDFDRHRGKKIQFNKEEMLSKFRANIDTFLSICRNHGIEPVLMTQQNRMTAQPDEVVQNRFEWFYSVQKLEYATYKRVYDEFNDEIRSVAVKNDVMCIDLDEKVPSVADYLYDVIHLRTAGSQYASRVIAKTMVEKLK